MSQSKLLFRILNDNSLTEALEEGLSRKHFTDEEDVEVFQYVQEHFSKYGKTPSVARTSESFPHYEFSPTKDSLTELINDATEMAKWTFVYGLVKDASLVIKEGIAKADNTSRMKAGSRTFDLMRSAMLRAELDFNKAQDLALNSDKFVDRCRAELDERALNDGVTGIPSPWPTINESTGGANPQDLIVITARPKLKKTWVIAEWSSDTWFRLNKNVLLVSNEISLMKMANRIVSQRSGVSYTHIRTGKLDEEQRALFEAVLERFRNLTADFIVSGSDDDMTAGGVASIEAKIVKYNPDVVFVDGAYLLEDDLQGGSESQKAGNVIRQLKKLAKRRNVPIIITWQFNRKATQTSGGDADIGLTDKVGQDADLVIGLFQTEDMILNQVLMLKSLAVREGAPFDCTINCKFATMDFTEISAPKETLLPDEETSVNEDDLPF